MIETWEAIQIVEEITRTRTKPLVLTCYKSDCDMACRKDFVVKCPGPEVTTRALLFEAVGYQLAASLGVLTPKPAIINITEQFIQSNYLAKSRFQIPLLTFGCEYMEGTIKTVKTRDVLSVDQQIQAVKLFAFDMLVHNSDRRTDNPNCAIYESKLYAFDFEFCFSLIVDIIKLGEPWEITKFKMSGKHALWRHLNRDAYIAPFISSLNELDENTIMGYFIPLPEEWKGYAERVINHIMVMKEHSKDFEEELRRCLP